MIERQIALGLAAGALLWGWFIVFEFGGGPTRIIGDDLACDVNIPHVSCKPRWGNLTRTYAVHRPHALLQRSAGNITAAMRRRVDTAEAAPVAGEG